MHLRLLAQRSGMSGGMYGVWGGGTHTSPMRHDCCSAISAYVLRIRKSTGFTRDQNRFRRDQESSRYVKA